MVRPKASLSRSELEAANEFAARAGLSLEQWLYALAAVADREAQEAPREPPRQAGDHFSRQRFFSDTRRYPEPRPSDASFVAETRGLLEASEQRTADALAKLLGWIESSSSRTEGEIGRIAETCGKISDNVRSSLDVINQRLSTVESTVRSGGVGAIPDLLQRIERKIAQLETSRAPGIDPAELSEAFAEFEQRLDGIARYIDDTQRTSTSQTERLNVVETALALALKRMEAAGQQQSEQAKARQHAPAPPPQEDRTRELQEVHAAIQQLQGSISVAVPRINAAAESVLSSVASAFPPELRAVPLRLDALDRAMGSIGQKVEPLAGLTGELPGIRAELARLSAALQPDLPSKLEALEESVNAIVDSFRRVDDTYRESRTANDSIVELIGRIGEIQSSVDDITARLPGNIGTLVELAKRGAAQPGVTDSLERLHDRVADLSAETAAPKEVLRRLDRLEQTLRTTGFDTLVEDATHKVAANLSEQVAETIRSVFDTFERNTRCDTILNTINARLTEVLQSPELARAKTEQVAAAAMAQAVAQASSGSQAAAAATKAVPAPQASPAPAAAREDDASRLARALRAAERAREAEPAPPAAAPEPTMPKASRAPDDYVTRLAHVSGGAYRQPPAMHAAASSADPAARREPQARAAAPSAAATQVLRDPPAAEGLRPHNQVPPAPPPPIVEKEPGKAGSRIMFPVAAASVVALMAGLGWAATSRYGESLHVTAMVERLKALPHVNDVLAMLGRPPGHGPQETVPASMGPPVSAETPVADLARAGAGAPLSSGARVAAPESRAGDMVAAAAPTAPVPVPPIPVRTRPEPESAPFPPSVPVVEARPSAAPQSSVAERPAEAADTPAAEANRAGRSLEERASVTGSIDAGPGASGSSAAALPKCPDYETAIISTGVTRCAPERPPAEPVARPERRSDAVTPAAPERQRVAAVTPAPAPARAAPPVPGQRPTLSAVEKAFFSKPLQDALVAEDAYASYDAGMRLLLGKGVPRDSKAAARWLKLAAEEGLAPAQYELGSIYELGTGVPKDIPLAMEWYGKAARSGNVRAMHNLGALLSDASFGTPDMESAAYWFRKAGEHGVRESQYNLGFLYVRGVGVPQDLTEAYLWFSLAAAQGDTNALKKKQMVMGLLDEDSLATAKRKAETFQGSIPDLAANTVDLSSKPWSRKKVIGS